MSYEVALISDIHSNYEALEAVLLDIEKLGIADVICLGDVVGYAADPAECVREVQSNCLACLKGNHDEAVLLPRDFPHDLNETAIAGVVFSQEHLGPEELAWLSELPHEIERGDNLFIHSSLYNPPDWNYILDPPDAFAHFAFQTHAVCFCGHTHRPGIWRQDRDFGPVRFQPGKGTYNIRSRGKILVNVGSVGQPRDGDNRPCYVVWREEEHLVEFRRVGYDILEARRKIFEAGLPEFTAERLLVGV